MIPRDLTNLASKRLLPRSDKISRIPINTGMKISEALDSTLAYHSFLNPAVWEKQSMKPEIRKALLDIATLFFESLDHKPKMLDIVVMGSMANYNWSKYSDVDLHIVVDIEDVEREGLVFRDYLYAQKIIWNKEHDIKIKEYDVEIYVQDVSEPYHSAGVYSLLDDAWVSTPKYFKPDINDTQVVRKAEYLANEISAIEETDCTNSPRIEQLKEKIKKMRQAGLDKDGEFSVGNLVFKVLRNNGLIDILRQKCNTATDSCYSVE